MSIYADISLGFLPSVVVYTCTLFDIDVYKNQLTRKNKNWFLHIDKLIKALLNISFKPLIYYVAKNVHAMLSFCILCTETMAVVMVIL